MAHARGVLFDMDGVLTLTEPLKAEAHVRAVRHFGGDLASEFYTEIMGSSDVEANTAMIRHTGIEVELDDYEARFQHEYRELLLTQLQLAPGAQSLVQTLRQHGFGLALVTSSKAWMVQEIDRQTGLPAMFDAVVTADDVTRKKPAPDAYLLALERLQVAAGAAVVFEDSQTGLAAGLAAGCPVIAVRHHFNRRHDFAGASAEVQSLEAVEDVLALVQRLAKAR